jgi:hypothetical protein
VAHPSLPPLRHIRRVLSELHIMSRGVLTKNRVVPSYTRLVLN